MINVRTQYALQILLDIVKYGASSNVSNKEIAKRQGISKSYVEQITRQLRRYGLLVSMNGPGGGYDLALGVSEISVGDVIGALNQKMFSNGVKWDKPERTEEFITFLNFVDQLDSDVMNLLYKITLADLMKEA